MTAAIIKGVALDMLYNTNHVTKFLLSVVVMVINSIITKYNLTNLNNMRENIHCLDT